MPLGHALNQRLTTNPFSENLGNSKVYIREPIHLDDLFPLAVKQPSEIYYRCNQNPVVSLNLVKGNVNVGVCLYLSPYAYKPV